MDDKSLTPDNTVSIHPDILATPMGDDLVMLNIETGTYFGVESVAKRIWELIETPTTIAAIVAVLCDEFDVTADDCEQDVIRFLTRAAAAKLITVK